MSTVPEPGIYRGVPAAVYHEWECASNSRLSMLARSPAHLREALDNPKDDTEAFLIGRATHAAVLEPDVFASTYIRGPEGSKRTKAVQEEWAAEIEEHGPENVLDPFDYDACAAMRDAVWARRSARGLLGGEGDVELSIVWDDPKTGVRCKGRLDRLSTKLAGGTIVDLKTTRDASLLAFERSIFNLGYHRQGAMYIAGARAVGLAVRHYSIIAVEKKAPWAVAVYRLTEGAIDAGTEQLEPLLERYAECQRTGEWPAYPDEVRDISLPPWAWSRIDDEKQIQGVA